MRVFQLMIVAVLVGMLLDGEAVLAISPEEQLSDPVLEARARGLGKQLRCLVCQNQSIDDSDAELAQDLRRLVREEIMSGKSDQQILERLRARYGDFILLHPPVHKGTFLLWLSPILIVFFGGVLFWMSRGGGVQKGAKGRELGRRSDVRAREGEGRKLSPAWIGAVAMVIFGAGLGLYGQLGRPDLHGMPLAARITEKQNFEATQKQAAAASQRAFIAAQEAAAARPDSVEAYLHLALAAGRAGQIEAEILAIKKAVQISGNAPEIQAMLAEVLSKQAGGQVTLVARDLIADVLTVAPNEPRALYLFGVAAFQDEEFQMAIDVWQKLQIMSVPHAPWQEQLEQNIEEAAKAGGIEIERE